MTLTTSTDPTVPADTREELLDRVRAFARERWVPTAFVPGVTPVQPAGGVHDEEDTVALVEAALGMRIAAGVSARRFERLFSRALKVRKAHLTNSGSSANLVALTALTSPALGDDRLRPGDEVVTVATSFPTTVNPILQNQMKPVFVDVDLGTYNTTVDRIADAIGPRTRAIMMAHTLGNPFQAAEVAELARDRGLFLVEDNCDAVGSTYRGRLTGGFGDLSTVSFYPAHHLAMGEGGCVLTDNLVLARVVESVRDWGRDCWCEPGEDDRCAKRFDQQFGKLPHGYDHKYVFSHVGYNLKTSDLHASLGLSQLRRLDEFTDARKRNWRLLREGLDGTPGLLLPEPTPDSDPSWFGFAVTVLPDAPFTRRELVTHLESRKIGTRLLFAGDLTRQPAYLDREFRVSGSLDNSALVTEGTFWLGVYPGITPEMAQYVIDSVRDFAAGRRRTG
ncbi:MULTISPECIES: lipopolysaccharide biosynthesis protein RfbH [Streptomyces]|uniref:Lipopolysaccharide biosynthesis protein RfbH n=1 Tax=Streptomyces hydrogenans TaxID=1873719 RepID=A0ABQ3PAW0_9ACTN|nr:MULTISPECIES: lipopolysaccharide biosynthesis protein RfbH [Streptomyces]MCM1948260.1 lipopolysaccharide biosynthesis protein RfbH [Streptomyces sp. G2]GHG44049.1 lipopolysaccharide biosynthesis protein RfbH [Streptomyces hydrogenans]GHI22174.1 lipopolysaccharide biosynthesis protein RfbH [Streptomyces hydrogenans]